MVNKKSNHSVLITGSAGLIGSEVCLAFDQRGFVVHGLDNNQRRAFFGPDGDTSWNQKRLETSLQSYVHHAIDIRDRPAVLELIRSLRPACIVHAAAQPSHDLAATIPFADFDTNAVGTLNLLEAARQYCPESPFVYMSTNKVYGDGPNTIRMRELDTRWDYDEPQYQNGIPESFSIDQSKHSLFGASKVAADVMVQEYGRYFGMPTVCLRGGCLTGPSHSGVELHGFLSYLVKCNLEEREYRIFGYKGKQVRDNIHAIDVAGFMLEFIDRPVCAAVYNLGGGKGNSCAILEAFQLVEAITGKPQRYSYVAENRVGDHICYYSDLRKMMSDYPGWKLTRSLPQILEEVVSGWQARSSHLARTARSLA
jgi:CDP-paratose 2-epimerase